MKREIFSFDIHNKQIGVKKGGRLDIKIGLPGLVWYGNITLKIGSGCVAARVPCYEKAVRADAKKDDRLYDIKRFF